MQSKKKLGLIFGGQSAEHEVSILSARSVYQAIAKDKFELIPIGINKKGEWINPSQSDAVLSGARDELPEREVDNIKESIKFFLELKLDVVFPLIHGPSGEDGTLQGFLETLAIPYVGCNVLASAVGMDKEIMKNIFSYHKLPQAKYLCKHLHHILEEDKKELYSEIVEELNLPFFIKPANLGSSIGITKVANFVEFTKGLDIAIEHDKKIIFEETIVGREIECAVFGKPGEIKVSIPGEIISINSFYDYQAKYQDQQTKLIIPAEVDKQVGYDLKNIAAAAFEVIDGFGLARVDFFITEAGRVLINEINTIPGFTRYSMYPKLFAETDFPYQELINKLVELALQRG